MENLYDTQHIEVWMENVWLCNFLSLTLAGVTPEFLSRVFFSFVFIVTEVVVAFCSHLTIENQWTLCFQKKKKPIENKDGELGWKQDIQINLTCCVMLLNSKLPQNDSQTAQKKKKEPVSRSAPATHCLCSDNSLNRNGLQWIPAELQTEEDSRAKGTVVVSSWAPHVHWEKTHSAVAATLAVKSSGYSL